MNTIDDLRLWAGLVAGDNTQDDLLRSIEAGVVALIESQTNRLYVTPPEPATEIFNGPQMHTGGLSRTAPGPQQWITLEELPIAELDGTFTVLPGETTVVGVLSKATEQLSESPATAITFSGVADPVLVETITDDTNFSLAEPVIEGIADATAEAAITTIETRHAGHKTWLELDPRDFEIERRRIYSIWADFIPGRRTVRVRYRRGFEEGEGPADAALLVNEMVGAIFSQRAESTANVSSVDIEGAYKITWGDFGKQSEKFQSRIDLLNRGLEFK